MKSYSNFAFTQRQFHKSRWCEVTLWGPFVATMGLCLLKQAFQRHPCSHLFHTAARWEHTGGSLHTSNGKQPDFPCAAMKESKNHPRTLTITALAGAEFYPVKQNLHRHCKLSLPVSPSRHKTLMSSVECAKNGKKSWHCLTQSQVGPVLTASQFLVEQVCIGLQTVC